ncbi:MAG: hypothetical protein JSV92_04995 [archaeon]|nr:MAG: hypothetical protein JSV92_04995 [archaeon]
MENDHMEGIEKVYHVHLRQSGPSICVIREEDRSGREKDNYKSEELKDSPWLKRLKIRLKTRKEINNLIGENVIFYAGDDYEFDVFHLRQGSKVGVHKIDEDYCLKEDPLHEIEGEKFYPFTKRDVKYVLRFFKVAFKNPKPKE